MLTQYIRAAMRRAKYEILEDGTYYGEILGIRGVFSNAETLEGCRDLLQEVLEGWMLVSFAHQKPIPVIDGIDLTVTEAEV
ncbi:MAG: type II toxin-antitoxin system HicB family antitoxin [Chloroflexi bacterium]|nr:type II toxin-antitoxin system HicB family antitoxin [Chloroflexota bacterium]